MDMDCDDMGFRHAFCSAIGAYKNGCIPIGCAILDSGGKLAARGENCQYSDRAGEAITNHPLAHAEINALLKTSAYTHQDIGTYTLYTTLEPCPLCFGAVVMGGIKSVKFAALDKHNEFAKLNTSVEFIAERNIAIEGPFAKYQEVQIALIVCRRLEMGFGDNEKIHRIYDNYCPVGAEMGYRLKDDAQFKNLLSYGENDEILDHVIGMIVN